MTNIFMHQKFEHIKFEHLKFIIHISEKLLGLCQYTLVIKIFSTRKFPYFLLFNVLSIELTLTHIIFLRHEDLVVSLLTTVIYEIKCRQIYCFQFNGETKLMQNVNYE